MSKHFTNFYLKSLKPREKAYDVREGGREGFAIRVMPTGRKSFLTIFNYLGKKTRVVHGHFGVITLADARELHRQLRRELELGKRPLSPTEKARRELANRFTVADLAALYMECHARPKKRSWRLDQGILEKHILPIWGDRAVSDIARRDVAALVEGIARTVPTQSNRVLSLVKSVLTYGVDRDLVDHSVAAGVKPPSPERVRTRVLSEPELSVLWAALDSPEGASPPVASIVRLLLLTGCRSGEICKARWQDIDTDQDVLTIPAAHSKNKRTHLVPLSKGAKLELTKALDWADASPWVFPGRATGNAISTQALQTALRRLQSRVAFPTTAERFTSHDFRRTVATGLARMGYHQELIGALLNHSDNSVTARHYDQYNRLEEKKRALDTWSDRLLAIVEGRELSAGSNIVPIR